MWQYSYFTSLKKLKRTLTGFGVCSQHALSSNYPMCAKVQIVLHSQPLAKK